MPFFEPLTPDYYGWGAHKDTPTGPQANGPFAYAGAERDARGNARGWSAGAGLLSGQIGGGARADVLEAQGHFGGWRDEAGKTTVGAEADAALVRMAMQPGNGLGPVGFDVGVLEANAGGKFTDSDASLGAYAALADGAITLGNKEHSIRGGLVAGVGFGGRLHYGDEDHDGIRELGFGVDVGPFEFDVKSEYLGRAANWIGDTASSAWGGIKSGASAVGGALSSAGSAASSAYNAITDW